MAGLNGYWTGWYDYGDGRGVTHFSACLSDMGGVLEGMTFELDRDGRELEASIDGDHHAGFAHFTKLYDADLPGYDFPVEYAGEVNSAGTKITGQWTIEGEEDIFGTAITFVGNFAMQRVSPLPRAAVERKASVDIKR